MPRMTSDVGPFAIVPEWVTDADISDRAHRLYTVLGSYADQEGKCFPLRKTLAARLRCSLNSLDRAKEELAMIGALTWTQTIGDDEVHGPNEYVLRYARPGSTSPGVGRGSPTGGARGSPRAGARNQTHLELDPATQGSPPPDGDVPPSIQDLVAGYVEDVRKVENGHEPTRAWKQAAGRAAKRALDDGEEPRAIAVCLGICASEGKNPSTLPHVLSDFHAKRPRRNQR